MPPPRLLGFYRCLSVDPISVERENKKEEWRGTIEIAINKTHHYRDNRLELPLTLLIERE